MKHYCCLIVLASSLCSAQESPLYLACNKHAKTQYDMNICASNEATRVDDELNRIYKLLLSRAADDPIATAKIKVAEKAWIGYRDAYLEAMYPAEDKQAEYGSTYPMEAALAGARITRQQAGALRELLKQY
jgi:uncharacterized protein YecT (DUF1311 family)